MDQASRDHIRHLWEDSDISGARIAALYGVSKNTIMGMAERGCWVKFGRPLPATIFDRMAALEARMAAVLAETAPSPRHHRTGAP